MISEAELQVLADLKSILYGLRSKRFDIKFCVELNAGCATVAPRGGRTGRRTSRGGGRTRGNQGSNQGNPRNQNSNAINDNIQGDVRNVIGNNNRRGCIYKELLACNPKEYDGKGGSIVYTHWIEKMESVQDMSRCEENQNVKYTTDSFVGKALTCGTDKSTHEAERFHELARLVPHLVTLENKSIERNGSLKKNPKKRRNGREPNRARIVIDENTKTRIRNAFATTTNPIKREYNGTIPKHMEKDYKVVPRMVNRVNARNPTAAPGACYECGGTYHFKAACPRTREEHEMHLGLVLKLLKKEKLYAKFSKCEFWLQEVQFHDGIHVDPSKIKVVKN
uniref:Reverse transcriptase domain-containing protein n=1 Tax=Tanacetum cinerariifolium TaxID=118510 RepID=A0A699HX14_TANCI|nr:hypothetical protein [Tanacetum cinerariifolium]